MNPGRPSGIDIPEVLGTAEGGDPRSLDRLVPFLYDELRGMAHRQLAREHGPPSLQTTGLVHEAYLRLVGGDPVTDRGRSYFFAAAARAMRQVLVDRARRRGSEKRGGRASQVTLTKDLPQTDPSVDAFAVELLDLERALRTLERHSPRQAKVVECRFFAGLTAAETAEALGVSTRTVESDWTMARAWLFKTLDQDRGPRSQGARE